MGEHINDITIIIILYKNLVRVGLQGIVLSHIMIIQRNVWICVTVCPVLSLNYSILFNFLVFSVYAPCCLMWISFVSFVCVAICVDLIS